MSALERLQKWYAAHCNEDWEHQSGVKIDTLDNPGWMVVIDLTQTELDGKPFAEVSELEPETDWIRCWVEGKKFNGVGGPYKLEEILDTFLTWAERN